MSWPIWTKPPRSIARRSADIDATIANANKAMANLSDASNSLRPTLEQVDLTIQQIRQGGRRVPTPSSMATGWRSCPT